MLIDAACESMVVLFRFAVIYFEFIHFVVPWFLAKGAPGL